MAYSFDRFAYRWANAHAILNLAGVSVLIAYDNKWALWWILTLGFSFMIYMATSMKGMTFKPLGLGYANLVTAGRLLFLLILSANYQNLTDLVLFIGFLAIVTLDGVDGMLARRFKQESKEGEMLDAETDAQFVLILSYIHFTNGMIGWWILIPGGLRYLYQLLFFWLPASNHPPKKVRATIAVIFFLSLTLAFILPGYLSQPLLIGSSLLICCSFGISLFKGIQLLIAKKEG